MRSLLGIIALAIWVVLPRASSAEELRQSQFRATAAGVSETSQLAGLLQRFGVTPIAKAQAAECTPEGEICTSNEQCCPGLECSGGPPQTCNTED